MTVEPSDWDVDEELDAVEMTVAPARKAEEFERRAADAEPGTFRHTELLLAAGEHHQRCGDFDRARGCFELAKDAGVRTNPSASAHLIALALAQGGLEEADTRARALRREARAFDRRFDCAFVGEALEEAGMLRDAARWFTLANADIDPDDLEALDASALAGRHRVRRALGLPYDRYDVSADAAYEHYRRLRELY